MKYNWPLQDLNFSLVDKLKLCSFLLNPNNRWSQDKFVKKYEEAWKKYTDARYTVFVSSGSTANTLIAQYTKDNLGTHFKTRNKVVFPSVTWQTSVAPWVREGFEPIFIDVNFEDFALDYIKLEDVLRQRANEIACVFPTSLLGFTPNIPLLKNLCKKYKVELKLDNCENSFGEYEDYETTKYGRPTLRHLCSEFTSSTSTYIGHLTTSIEGGIIFANNEDEYLYYLMARNHGMTRSLSLPLYKNNIKKDVGVYSNKLVNPSFDFYCLGNNFRNTDINAFIGLLDFKYIYKYIRTRTELYNIYSENLNAEKFILPKKVYSKKDVAFCLPIILRNTDTKKINKIKEYCVKNSIETRPIISGNLLRQTPYRKYGNYQEMTKAEHLNRFGIYVGLYPNLNPQKVEQLAQNLNKI